MKDPFHQLAQKYKTPKQVQNFLFGLAYNREKGGETLRSAVAALKYGQAHCLEAAFIAAAILERHDYPPLVVSLESKDGLDHVIYVFQQNNRWGSIGRSRDRGLNGRPAVFRTLRELAWSYYDPYVDENGMVKAYQVFHLDETSDDWRYSSKFLWPLENYLCEEKHISLKSSRKRYLKALANYKTNGPLTSHPQWW